MISFMKSPAFEGYSTISSIVRFFSLAETAFNMVRRAPAVRPCLPMIFPMSALATLSSNMDVCAPQIYETVTNSGLSTRACAMISISFFIVRLLPSVGDG